MAQKKSTKKKQKQLIKTTLLTPRNMILALLVILVAAGTGGYITSRSKAQAYSYMWGPTQFKGASAGSIKTKGSSAWWSSEADKDGIVYVGSTLRIRSEYCVTLRGNSHAGFFFVKNSSGKITQKVSISYATAKQRNVCQSVPGTSGSGRTIGVDFEGASTKTNNEVQVLSIWRR